MKDCKFCQILSGSLESNIVLDEDNTLGFLDIRPLIFGHCLLIPKKHIITLNDLPDELIPDLFKTAKKIAKALESGLEAQGTFVAMNNRISQSVPHLHIHIVPRYKQDGLKGFFWPRHQYASEAHVRETKDKIIEALRRVE